VAEIRPYLAAKVRAGGIGGQIAAAVRRADLDPRIAVECAVENQMRERNRGLERVADYVRQIAVTAETMAELRGGPVALRMDEDEDAERLCFGPERVERRVRDFLAGDVADAKRPKGSIWISYSPPSRAFGRASAISCGFVAGTV
jgi:hypothetical protein